MKVTSVIALISLAVTATAIPTGGPQQQCGSKQTISCCNTDTSGSTTKKTGFLLNGISVLSPGQCATVPLSILQLVGILGLNQICGANQVDCCNGGPQSGLINLNLNACVPVNV